jgi:hypothetical protein
MPAPLKIKLNPFDQKWYVLKKRYGFYRTISKGFGNIEGARAYIDDLKALALVKRILIGEN